MEIFKFNIRPQAEIEAREEFNAESTCEGCGDITRPVLIVLKECNTLKEKISCKSCGHQTEKSHTLQ